MTAPRDLDPRTMANELREAANALRGDGHVFTPPLLENAADMLDARPVDRWLLEKATLRLGILAARMRACPVAGERRSARAVALRDRVVD